jgi:drug/metabolite transporter (DMT)-like permease
MKIVETLKFLVVSFCWGFTNPFIKRGSKGVELVAIKHHKYTQFYELWYLLTRWQYLLPMSINLSGSSLFYYLLGDAQLSIAVPITNALTFVMTFIAGWLLGEKITKHEMVGIACILAGVAICVL